MLAESDFSEHGGPGLPGGETRLCIQLDWHVDPGDITGLTEVAATEMWLWRGCSGLRLLGVFLLCQEKKVLQGWEVAGPGVSPLVASPLLPLPQRKCSPRASG